jgi:glutaredoxin
MKKRSTICFITIIVLLCGSVFAAKPKIVVYSMQGCGYCKKLKEYLKEKNIAYQERDIIKDESAGREMERKSHQGGVPVLDWEGTIIVGFGPKTKPIIDKLIRKHPPQASQPNSSASAEGGIDVNSNSDPHLAPFRSKIENLETLFQDVQIYIDEKGIRTKAGVRILKKCFEANLAKFVYEFCQSQDFAKAVEKGSLGTITPEQTAAVIAAAQNITFKKYQVALAEFCEICSQKPEVTSRTKWILEKATAQNNPDGFSSKELFNICSDFTPQPQEQEKKIAKQDIIIETKAAEILKILFEPTTVETEK